MFRLLSQSLAPIVKMIKQTDELKWELHFVNLKPTEELGEENGLRATSKMVRNASKRRQQIQDNKADLN